MKTSRILLAAFVAALGFASPTQAAAPARGLGDLIGDNHGQSGKQLRERGFVRQSRDATGSTLVEHWWNDDRNRCVELTLRRGRVSTVENASPVECGQQQTVTRRPGDWRNDRDTDDWLDEQEEREAYRRGYEDGLRRAGYDRRYERDDVDDYDDGYRAGKAARERRYDGDDDSRSRRALDDLVGDRTSSANDELRRRGFDHLYSGKVKGEPVSSWWNADTRQCIDVVLTEDGDRVEDIRHLGVDSCL